MGECSHINRTNELEVEKWGQKGCLHQRVSPCPDTGLVRGSWARGAVSVGLI